MAQSHINAGIHVAFAASSSTVLFVFEQEAYSEHVGISNASEAYIPMFHSLPCLGSSSTL